MARSLSVFILFLLLAGCNIHRPVQVTLPVELPERYQAAAVGGVSEIMADRWWESFADDQLNVLMEELFRQNLQLEQGFARLQQARASTRVVRSARFPALQADAETGRSMQPTYAGDFTGDNAQFAAVARFELDLWGKLAAREGAAAKSAEAIYEDLQTLYLGLSAQLADLYFWAVEQRAQLALTEETIASFTDTLERVESRYRMGLVPAVDVYQARQSLGGARANRQVFEANLAEAEHALAVLIGRYPDRSSAGDLAVLPATLEAFPDGLPAELIRHRPDLRAALRRIEAADQEVAAAIADRFPSLNLLGSYGETRQELTTGLLKGDFWSLLGELSLPIFDAGRRRAVVERTRAVVREAVAGYQQTVLGAFREVEDALFGNYATELRIARLAETEQATGASLRLSLQNYLYGVTDYLPVLTAQRNHFEAQSRLLSARRQLLSDRISLARALGGSWMTEEIERRFSALPGEK